MNLQDKINGCIPELIQFYVANNTNSNYEINLTNPNFSANATTRYQFDVTNSDFYSSLEGSIVINGITYVFNYGANGIDSFVNALNDLGFGFFFISTIGINTYINVYDNTNVYGSLNIATTIYTEVNTIADLRLINGTNNIQTYVDVLGYYTFNGDGGGRFYWNSTSTATDDGGSVIQATGVAVGRWYRIFDNLVSVKYFGAKGDDSTNDLPFFNNAWGYCLFNKTNMFVPKGTYNLATGVLNYMIDFTIIGIKFQSVLKTSTQAGIIYIFEAINSGFKNISFINLYVNAVEQFPAVVSTGTFALDTINFTIENCYFTNPQVNTAAISIYANGTLPDRQVIDNVKFINNIFDNIGREVMTIYNRSDEQNLMNNVQFINNTSQNLGVYGGGLYGEVGFVISYDDTGQNIRIQNNYTKNWKQIGFEIFDTKVAIIDSNLFNNIENFYLSAPFSNNQRKANLYNDIYMITSNNIAYNSDKSYMYGVLYCNYVSNIYYAISNLIDTACALDIRSSAYCIIANDILIGYDRAIFTSGEILNNPQTMFSNLINNSILSTRQNVNLTNYGVTFFGTNVSTPSLNNFVINCNVYFKYISVNGNLTILEFGTAFDNFGVDNFYNGNLVDYPTI